jgi:hypothetical protein
MGGSSPPGARAARGAAIDAAPVLEPAPLGTPGQGAGTPGLLPLGVLVGAFAVAAAAAQPGQAQPGRVHDALLGADGALRPRRRGRQPGPQRQPGPRGGVSGDIGVVVAGYEHQRHVEHVHQAAQVLEGQVAAGDDQLGRPHRVRIRQQGVVDLIGDGQDKNHSAIVRRGRSLPPGWMIHRIWPSVQLRARARQAPGEARWMERSGIW